MSGVDLSWSALYEELIVCWHASFVKFVIPTSARSMVGVSLTTQRLCKKVVARRNNDFHLCFHVWIPELEAVETSLL
jgi:hypothetical protein